MPNSQYELLQRYWTEEPWGPWRDNLHAAIVASEVLRASGRYKPPLLDVFMWKRSKAQTTPRDSKAGIFNMLKTMAIRRKRSK